MSLPEFAIWNELHPDTVRKTPELISGTALGVIQLIGSVILMDKLKIDTLKDGTIFGIIFSAVLWLIIDLQMISMTNIFYYDYLFKDIPLFGSSWSIWRTSYCLVSKKIFIKAYVILISSLVSFGIPYLY